MTTTMISVKFWTTRLPTIMLWYLLLLLLLLMTISRSWLCPTSAFYRLMEWQWRIHTSFIGAVFAGSGDSFRIGSVLVSPPATWLHGSVQDCWILLARMWSVKTQTVGCLLCSATQTLIFGIFFRRLWWYSIRRYKNCCDVGGTRSFVSSVQSSIDFGTPMNRSV